MIEKPVWCASKNRVIIFELFGVGFDELEFIEKLSDTIHRIDGKGDDDWHQHEIHIIQELKAELNFNEWWGDIGVSGHVLGSIEYSVKSIGVFQRVETVNGLRVCIFHYHPNEVHGLDALQRLEADHFVVVSRNDKQQEGQAHDDQTQCVIGLENPQWVIES